MTVYMCDIHEIKKHAQVKVILAFTTESVSSCFLIHYICTIHAIVVTLDDVRTRNSNVLWILSYIHQYIAQACFKILFQMMHSSDCNWTRTQNHLILILWHLSVLSCFLLPAKWLFCKTTWYLGLAKIFWMPTLPAKWLQSQNIDMLGNWFTVMM